MKKTIPIFLILFLTIAGFSQELDSILISGQIVSKNKKPVPGATINIVDTKTSTITDINGKFKIIVPKEGVLKIVAISEPLYLSLWDVITQKTTYYTLILKDLEIKKGKRIPINGEKVRLNKKNKGSHIMTLVANYTSNIKNITLKYYNKYINTDNKINISLIVNGLPIEDNLKISDLDYSNFSNASIIKLTPNNYAFIFSKKKK